MAIIYIDPSSSTNGVGTLNDPRNTWVGVTWTAGNSYLQKCGTYFVTASGGAGRIAPTISGTTLNPITIGKYGTGPNPVIINNADTGINVDQRSNIIVQDLVIIGGTVSAIGGGGGTSAPMHNVIVRRNTIYNTTGCGMLFQTQLDRFPTIGLRVYNNVVYDAGYHGISFVGEHYNSVAYNNTIIRGGKITPGHGLTTLPHRTTFTPSWTLVSGTIYSVAIGAQAYKTTVTDIYSVFYATTGVSLIKNTSTPTTPANGEFGFSGSTLYINVGVAPSGSVSFSYSKLQICYKNNLIIDYGNITDSESKGIQADDMASDCYIIGNIIKNPKAEGIACNMGQRNVISGNLIINPIDQGIRADINGAKNNLVINNTIIAGDNTSGTTSGIQLGFGNTARNNIIKGFSTGITGASAQCIISNNSFWQCESITGGTLTNQGNNVTSDPLLTSDYKLSSSSPCVSAGEWAGVLKDIENKSFKNPPSIGAYQHYPDRSSSIRARLP